MTTAHAPPNAGPITAGLFLEEFVDGTPWAHIDIGGTDQAEAAWRWIPKRPSGFGARLIAELTCGLAPMAPGERPPAG